MHLASFFMNLIETHAHLDDPRFEHDRDALIDRAHAAGVRRIVTIGTSMASNHRTLALVERYPSLYAALGIHPLHLHEEKTTWWKELKRLATHPKVVALGEIGLDYYHLPSDLSSANLIQWREEQLQALQAQLDLAVALGFNVIIHQRDLPLTKKKELSEDSLLHQFNAWDDLLTILSSYQKKLSAVFHCFGGSVEQMHSLLDQGHVVSFTGIVTFKNASLLAQTIEATPRNHYMIETDAPYLAPVPHRGERAEPAHVRLIAEKIAQLRRCSLQEVAAETTLRAEAFFRFSP